MNPLKAWALLGIAMMVTGFMSWATLVFTGSAFDRPVLSVVALGAMVIGALISILSGSELLIQWLTR